MKSMDSWAARRRRRETAIWRTMHQFMGREGCWLRRRTSWEFRCTTDSYALPTSTMENVWRTMKQRIKARTRFPATFAEMGAAVQEEWDRQPADWDKYLYRRDACQNCSGTQPRGIQTMYQFMDIASFLSTFPSSIVDFEGSCGCGNIDWNCCQHGGVGIVAIGGRSHHVPPTSYIKHLSTLVNHRRKSTWPPPPPRASPTSYRFHQPVVLKIISTFSGLKRPTSRGCRICVESGVRQ